MKMYFFSLTKIHSNVLLFLKRFIFIQTRLYFVRFVTSYIKEKNYVFHFANILFVCNLYKI